MTDWFQKRTNTSGEVEPERKEMIVNESNIAKEAGQKITINFRNQKFEQESLKCLGVS